MAFYDALFRITGYSYEPSEQELRIKGVNEHQDYSEIIEITIKNPTPSTIAVVMEAYDRRYVRDVLVIGLNGNTAWEECG